MTENVNLVAWRTRRFLDFIFHSATRYSIHSPFLYSLVDQVVAKPKNRTSETYDIEALRREFLNNEEIIQKTDHGSGAGHGTISTYPVKLSRIARTSLTSSRHALRYFNLVRHLKSSAILELGTSLGFTTAYLARANAGGMVVSIEGCPELGRIARANLEKLGISNTQVLSGRFDEKLDEALKILGRPDLVFIDGDHRKESVLENFERCLSHIHNDSVIILDDIHGNPGMEEAWELLAARDDVRVSLDLFFSGWLFFRKESSKEHFRLRYL